MVSQYRTPKKVLRWAVPSSPARDGRASPYKHCLPSVQPLLTLILGCLASAKIWNGRPVLQLGYSSAFFGKQRKIHSQCLRVSWLQRRGLNLSWLSPFIHWSPPHSLSLPYAKWAGQEGLVFVSPEVLPSFLMDFLLFYFCRLFSFLSFRHCHFGLCFPIPTT